VTPTELAELPRVARWSTERFVTRPGLQQGCPRHERLGKAALGVLSLRPGSGTSRDVPESEVGNPRAKPLLELRLRLAEEVEGRLPCSSDAIELGEDNLHPAVRVHNVGVEQTLQYVGGVSTRAGSPGRISEAIAVNKHNDGVRAPQKGEPCGVLLRILRHAEQLPRHRRQEHVPSNACGLR